MRAIVGLLVGNVLMGCSSDETRQSQAPRCDPAAPTPPAECCSGAAKGCSTHSCCGQTFSSCAFVCSGGGWQKVSDDNCYFACMHKTDTGTSRDVGGDGEVGVGDGASELDADAGASDTSDGDVGGDVSSD